MLASQAALQLNCERLSRLGRVYMWTFTFPYVFDLPVARRMWSELSARLVSVGFDGIRVFELHKEHGLHIHCLVVGWHDVGDVRKITTAFGFGRIDVRRCFESGLHYVSKYVTKQARKEYPCLKGVRLWAYIGSDRSEQTRVSDLRKVSHVSTVARQLIGLGHDPYFACIVAGKICVSLLAGDLDSPSYASWAMYYINLFGSGHGAVVAGQRRGAPRPETKAA